MARAGMLCQSGTRHILPDLPDPEVVVDTEKTIFVCELKFSTGMNRG
jgi:hypothetical protein